MMAMTTSSSISVNAFPKRERMVLRNVGIERLPRIYATWRKLVFLNTSCAGMFVKFP